MKSMSDLHLDLHPKTAKRLRKVLELSSDPETFAQDIIAYQINELKRAVLNLKLDIKVFEEKYKLSTDDFYRQFSRGATDDHEDYIVWAGLYELLQKNEKQLQELQ